MAAWRVLGLTAALFLATSSAWADYERSYPSYGDHEGHRAPEIDPGSLGSAAALVLGGTAVIAAGRSRRAAGPRRRS
jgi:hypothetical protein